MGDVFLLLGPEKGLKEDFIKNIKNSIGQCDISRFYAFDDYEEELFAQLNNNDLFADRKLIILDEAQEIKTKDKTKGIVEYINNPSETVTFLISSKELYIHADIMNAVKSDNIMKFYELFESKKNEWLKSFFKRNGLEIQNDACAAIIEKVENNIQEFEAVCSQLATYLCATNRNVVTEPDVEEFLSHTRQESEFSLFGYIARKDLSGALECLQALLHTNDEATMAAVLASRLSTFFRRLFSIEVNLAKRMSIDDALKTKYFDTDRAIVVPKDKDTYKNAVNNYKLEDVQRILKKLAVYDIEIKEVGTYLQQTMMEKCIMDIVINKCK